MSTYDVGYLVEWNLILDHELGNAQSGVRGHLDRTQVAIREAQNTELRGSIARGIITCEEKESE
jgi:hypothetical protein